MPMLNIGGSGIAKPFVKFNAKADKWFVRSPEGGDQEIARPTFLLDLKNIRTGWLRFREGQAPERRARPHPRALMAKRLGATIMQVSPGYLSTVQARAREYSRQVGAKLAPFGIDMPEAIEMVAAAARSIGIEPDEVWCASGSGVLARALAVAWPKARRHVVQVGRRLEPNEVAGATIHAHPLPFGREATNDPPFPSDPHYDAKAWEQCGARKGPGCVLFWNVAGPAQP